MTITKSEAMLSDYIIVVVGIFLQNLGPAHKNYI